jgi:hypothetical protein
MRPSSRLDLVDVTRRLRSKPPVRGRRALWGFIAGLPILRAQSADGVLANRPLCQIQFRTPLMYSSPEQFWRIFAFDNNQRDIVVLLLRAERPHFIYHRRKEPLCRQRQISAQCFHQPLLSKFLSPAVQ